MNELSVVLEVEGPIVEVVVDVEGPIAEVELGIPGPPGPPGATAFDIDLALIYATAKL